MESYDERRLVRLLELYDGELTDSVSVEDLMNEALPRMNEEESFYGPLAGISDLFSAAGNSAARNFGYYVASEQDIRGEVLDFAQRSGFAGFAMEKREFDTDPQYMPPEFSDYGEYLLELMATSRADLIGPTREIAMGVVTSGRYAPPEGTTGYFGSPAKLGVFALEMLAVMRGEVIDWESFHIPPDRFWLDCARIGLPEPDPVKAAEWGLQLCDAHMATLQGDKDNDDMYWFQGFEMVNEAHHLWPISVYAFIRARAQMGFATAEIDHPLMRTSFAILKGWTVPAGSWQAQPWFTEILDRIQQIEPALEPALDLVRN